MFANININFIMVIAIVIVITIVIVSAIAIVIVITMVIMKTCSLKCVKRRCVRSRQTSIWSNGRTAGSTSNCRQDQYKVNHNGAFLVLDLRLRYT